MKFRTRAKTAYGLLSEVRKLILEEPLRYNQGDVLHIKGSYNGGHIYDTYPDCGTVGCVAGWVTVLTASRPSKVRDILGYAGKVLGLSERQQDRLTDGGAAGLTGASSQTREHAERGAAHIRLFQQDYAAQLKRTKI